MRRAVQDFSFVRVYGEYFSMPLAYGPEGARTEDTRSGVGIGTRLFF